LGGEIEAGLPCSARLRVGSRGRSALVVVPQDGSVHVGLAGWRYLVGAVVGDVSPDPVAIRVVRCAVGSGKRLDDDVVSLTDADGDVFCVSLGWPAVDGHKVHFDSLHLVAINAKDKGCVKGRVDDAEKIFLGLGWSGLVPWEDERVRFGKGFV